jgi:hypothetical protein
MRRRLEGEPGAGGMTVYRCRSSGRGYQRTEVLELALDRVRRGIAAVAATAAVEVEHRELLCEPLGQRARHGSVAGGSAHHDHRRAVARLVERYGRPVR